MEEHPEASPAEVGWSLVSTRSLFDHRAVVVGEDRAELLTGLEALARGEQAPQLVQADPGRGRTAFLFSGQGSQRPGMGAELYRTYPVFAEALDEICGHFDALLGRSLRELVFASPGSDEGQLLHRTGFAQPALFALETALYRLVRSLGAAPDFLIGHSVGEISAAHAAGVLTLADACKLVAARARLMEAAPDSGGMIAVEADEEEIRGCIGEFDGSVAVAAVNSPQSVVISGERPTVEKVAAYWEAQGRRTTTLRVSHAFHSAMMDGVLAEFRAVAETVSFAPPRIPVVSNVTGRPATAGELCTADYWARQLRNTVRFMDGVSSLLAEGVTTFVELGPDATLTALAEACVAGNGPTPTLTSVLRRDRPEARTLATALAEAHVANSTVARPLLGCDATQTQVDLPTYPFQRTRYWLEAKATVRRPSAGREPEPSTGHPLLGTPVEVAGTRERWFGGQLSADRPWLVRDHRVLGRSVLPGSAMVEWALAAARTTARMESTAWTLRDLTFNAFLPLPDDGTPITVQAAVQATTHNTHQVHCYSRDFAGSAAGVGDWTEHATVGSVGPGERPRPVPGHLTGPTEPTTELPTGPFYDSFRRTGLDYGPPYRALHSLRRDGDRATGLVVADEAARDQDAYLLHPVVLDACFQLVGAFLAEDTAPHVPAAVDRIDVYGALPARVVCRARRHDTTVPGSITLDLEVSAESGEVLVTVEGLLFRAVPRSALAPAAPAPRRYTRGWQPRPDLPVTPVAPRDGDGAWLVCGTDPRAAEDWCERLSALGVPATAVAIGAQAPRPESGTLHVDAGSADDVPQVLDAARGGTERPLAGLILLADAADAADAPGDDATVGSTYELARRSTAVLAGFLRGSAAENPTVVLCSTGGDGPADVHAAPDPAQSVLFALTRSVVAEYPDLTCVQVDLEPGAEAPDPGELLGHLAALGGPGHLAVREGRWYELRLREEETAGTPTAVAPHDEAATPDAHQTAAHQAATRPALPVRDGASYLITGGLGGLGLATASWLAERGAACLLLVGRTPTAAVPPEVTALRSRGVRVELLPADMANTADVERVLAYAQRELPPLRGVVHAAGVTGESVLEQTDWSQLSRVLDPKVKGAWNLHHHTHGLDLDFFVLYSAFGATTGLAGQPGYLMANAFLDALAALRRHQGLPALSVGWGTWADTGMAAGAGLVERFAEAGLPGMQTAEALDALGRIPADGPAWVALAAVDWQRYDTANPRPHPDTLLADLRGPAASPDDGTITADPGTASAPGAVPDLAALALDRPEEAREDVLERLLDLVVVLLGMSTKERDAMLPTFRHKHLNELGFDSLSTIRLRNRLRADLCADVPADFLFGGGTADEIAELICRQLTARSVLAGDDEPDDDTEVLTL
ncbi:SDR family NAD(P)-dependent oxidoreductase [Streptomyces finlayi]|uniref:SDR family NAD(P)-dependent oxidoreductase n=1 Tax=Streptomyces finlayi TaxID=67296 RepID=UPI0016798521|nr:SDR family NAD(P)-dependent oxidoreductase [Streptomyces finlayi]